MVRRGRKIYSFLWFSISSFLKDSIFALWEDSISSFSGDSIHVFSQYLGTFQRSLSVVLEGGYKVSFFITSPFDMVISLDLHRMKASVVANHGLRRITERPSMLVLGWINRKYTGYLQKSKVTSVSSRTPTGLTLNLSKSSSIMGVGQRVFKCNVSMVKMVMIFIASLKLIKYFLWGHHW